MNQPLNAELIPYDLPSRGSMLRRAVRRIKREDDIAGWYIRPDGRAANFPASAIITATAVSARPLDLFAIRAQGMCVLSMDCRGQNGHRRMPPSIPEGTSPAG